MNSRIALQIVENVVDCVYSRAAAGYGKEHRNEEKRIGGRPGAAEYQLGAVPEDHEESRREAEKREETEITLKKAALPDDLGGPFAMLRSNAEQNVGIGGEGPHIGGHQRFQLVDHLTGLIQRPLVLPYQGIRRFQIVVFKHLLVDIKYP